MALEPISGHSRWLLLIKNLFFFFFFFHMERFNERKRVEEGRNNGDQPWAHGGKRGREGTGKRGRARKRREQRESQREK